MAKKNSIGDSKPKVILELEGIYKVNLAERHNCISDDDGYTINDNGEINGFCLREVVSDFQPIFELLPDIEILNLTNGKLVDISHLSNFKKLKKLYFGNNKINDISIFQQTDKLVELYIWQNPILSYDHLCYLKYLKRLSFTPMKTEDLEPIANLVGLTHLDINSGNVKSINALKNLKELIEIEIFQSNLEDIGVINELDSLITAKLRSNKIKIVPSNVAQKFDWLEGSLNKRANIILTGNPLTYPPTSVVSLGSETTKDYYGNAEKYGYQPLSEGRIIFIGDGSAGKSSIIEKILYGSFTLGREQTNGIKIESYKFPHPEDARELSFHIWDFGGQEIQHAVHKFFFTEGCLYVLVLDNRKEEEPEYWLQQIESLGGNAPVLVVFNKQDENAAETADRKYLREKYPNIIGFYNTSCKTNFGINDFKKDLEKEVVKLRTVEEQFPNNWILIKKAIEERTTGSQHYLTYESYQDICRHNHAYTEETQKLLLKYFNTIGAVTWFGEDTYLMFLHVLNPTWITQGVYKILTSKKTATLFGKIKVSDFKELLQPISKEDYTYEESHYGYILSMMQKFDLCDTQDANNLLIPSAFGKEPKVEYSEFKGEEIRTYILQFKDYMPLALIHRFTAKKIKEALDNNYWYTGIVIKDNKSNSIAMVHADKEAKRVYVRIKGEAQLGMWEYIRREFDNIASSYARIPYDELVAVDENIENYVNYEDLISHVQAKKVLYFHPKLKKDFNVGYLMGFFQSKETTLEKIRTGEIAISEFGIRNTSEIPSVYQEIVNNISPIVNVNVHAQINIDIDINIVNSISSTLKGDAKYLLEALGDSTSEVSEALKKVIQFSEDAKSSRNTGDIKERSWGRKLKNVIEVLSKSGGQLKDIQDGKDVLLSILDGLHKLAINFNLSDISDLFMNIELLKGLK